MEVKLGEAPSSKEENEVEAVQLVGVDLRRRSSASSGDAPARWRGFNGGGEGEAPP